MKKSNRTKNLNRSREKICIKTGLALNDLLLVLNLFARLKTGGAR